MEALTAEVRVTSQIIKPFTYKVEDIGMVGGESIELRASGFWKGDNEDHFPVSLHLTVYPGHGVIPEIGDCLTISVTRN